MITHRWIQAAAWAAVSVICGERAMAQVEVGPFRRRIWAGEDINWGGNRLTNPSFEEGFAGWSTTLGARQIGDVIRSVVETSDTVAYTGAQSLHLNGDTDTTLWLAVESDPVAVTAGATYRFSAWMKTDLVECEGVQYRNCNLYIRFMDASGEAVPVEDSPVRGTRKLYGTHDWVDVSRIIKAPEGSARAVIGCALTCTGWAWFDDLGLYEGQKIDWKRRVDDQFIFFYEDGPGPSDEIAKETESYLIALEKFLGFEYPDRLWYYHYDSPERMEAVAGARRYDHGDSDEVHALRWNDRHDIVHVVMNVLGGSAPLLAEGIATYAAEAAIGRAADVHAEARTMARATEPLSIAASLSSDAFHRLPQESARVQAGSFVGFLIERFGMDKFKGVYALKKAQDPTTEFPKRYRDAYGVDLAELERAWRESLLGPSENSKP